MSKRARLAILLAVVGMVLAGVGAWAGEIEQQARTVLEQHKEAVVTVSLVVKQRFSMMGHGLVTRRSPRWRPPAP